MLAGRICLPHRANCHRRRPRRRSRALVFHHSAAERTLADALLAPHDKVLADARTGAQEQGHHYRCTHPETHTT